MKDTINLASPLAYADDHVQSPWDDACSRLLAAIDPSQSEAVRRLLDRPYHGGGGLRAWIDAIAWRGAFLSEHIPTAVIDVFLHDSEAMPLYDCEDCGLAVPVRPNRVHLLDADPEHVYFIRCPVCGGRTGPYAYCSKQSPPRYASLPR